MTLLYLHYVTLYTTQSLWKDIKLVSFTSSSHFVTEASWLREMNIRFLYTRVLYYTVDCAEWQNSTAEIRMRLELHAINWWASWK